MSIGAELEQHILQTHNEENYNVSVGGLSSLTLCGHASGMDTAMGPEYAT